MKKTFLPLLALVTACAMAAPAIAEVRDGAFTVSPFVGGYTFDGVQHLKTNVATGLGLGYNLTGNWGVEGRFTWAPLHATRGNIPGEYSLFNAHGDVLYHFMPESRLVPFVALGGGVSWTEWLTYNNSDAILVYGGGVKYFLNDWLALRGDVHHIFSFHTTGSNGTDYWQNFEYTAGLSFQFGGTKPAAAQVTAEAPEAKAPAPPPAEVKPAPTPAPPPAVEPTPVPAPVPVKEEPTSWRSETTAVIEGKIMVTGMKVDQNALEITASERIRDYKVFTLSQPSRLVIDINNGANALGVARIPVHKLGIAAVRFGSYPDRLRVVFDAAQSELLPYRIEETDMGLKIIMAQ